MTHRLCTSLLVAALIMVATGGCASADTSTSGQKSAAAYTELGMAYLSRGQSERASSAFGKALARSPNEAAALHGMALLEQRAGNAVKSASYYDQTLQALGKAPDTPDNKGLAPAQVRNNYASLLYGQGKLHSACQQLEKAAGDTHYSGRAGILVNLSQCQMQLGQSQASHQTLMEANRIAPNLPIVMLALAYDSYERGNFDEARAQLAKYRGQAGDSKDAQVLEAVLAKQHDNNQ